MHESTPRLPENSGATKEDARRAEREIRIALARVLRKHRGKRAYVARELTKRTGVLVTESMLNDWCSETKSVRFPLSLVRALCEITGSDEMAYLGMRDDLRERAEIGAVLRPLLKRWVEQQQSKPSRERQQRKAQRERKN
jgi:hypothetical protein